MPIACNGYAHAIEYACKEKEAAFMRQPPLSYPEQILS